MKTIIIKSMCARFELQSKAETLLVLNIIIQNCCLCGHAHSQQTELQPQAQGHTTDTTELCL